MKSSTKTFTKSSVLITSPPLHYCPGCTHGIAHRLVAECIDELSIQECTVGVASVGCSVFAYNYFDCDMIQASHGRAPAVATGIKRANTGALVFCYQGDGDLASIGMAEIVHAAARNENITVIFINNGTYGMTGGQMAPTSLINQITTTSKNGKTLSCGIPIKVPEMLATMKNNALIARASTHNAQSVINAKKLIKRGFEHQIANRGFSLIELLCNCPTNWKMTPVQSLLYIENDVIKTYPPQIFHETENL